MSKKKIVIASILKPLLDSRHYERFALSLAKTNKYEVNIIANGEKKPDTGNIRFHSNGRHNRRFIHRIKLHWSTYIQTLQLKPNLFIVCTVELLPFASLYSLLSGCKLIYDIQENYSLNFKHLKEYGWTHRWVLAPIVTGLERLSGLFVHQFFLAEQCYEHQLNFINSKFTVLENKTVLEAPVIRNKTRNKKKIKLLFSGTISEYSGAYQIFRLISHLKTSKLAFEFTIIGQVFEPKLWSEFQNISVQNINIKIEKTPVSHDQIKKEIEAADIGVIAYQSQEVNAKKIPTKLYEYVAFGLPFLVEKNSYWLEVGSRMGVAIPFDFMNPDGELLNQLSKSIDFKANYPSQQLALWKTEEDKLLTSISTLLK